MLMRSCNGGIPSSTTEVKVNLHNCEYILYIMYIIYYSQPQVISISLILGID